MSCAPGMRRNCMTIIKPDALQRGNVGDDFKIEGRPKPEPGQELSANLHSGTSEYFQAIGIPLRRGRYFTAQD